MPVLKVDHLSTEFDTEQGVVRAVRDVSFSVEQGEILGIVGESGSGKSVTMFSIMGLLAGNGRVTEGSVLLDGEDLSVSHFSGEKEYEEKMRTVRGNQMSMIFQDPMTFLNPVLRIETQLVEPILNHTKLSRKQAVERAIELMRKVGIPAPEKRIRQYPNQFSGGMRQRIIIAIALACNPKLIIADEPTTALDVTVQAQVLGLMQDLQKRTNTSIILVTHNLGVVWKMCDKVMVMYAGKTVEYADVKTLYQDAQHPYTWGLLRSMPKITDDPSVPLASIPGTPPDLKLTGGSCNFYNRCKYCQEICKTKCPEMREASPGHLVACHFTAEELKKIGGEEGA